MRTHGITLVVITENFSGEKKFWGKWVGEHVFVLMKIASQFHDQNIKINMVFT